MKSHHDKRPIHMTAREYRAYMADLKRRTFKACSKTARFSDGITNIRSEPQH